MAQRIFIINAHGIGRCQRPMLAGEADCWVDTTFFEEVLGLVQSRPEVRLTFDDGNTSDVTEALPRLLARGVRARFFISAGKIGQDGYLGAAEIRLLHQSGMAVGNHGMHHRDWRRADRHALEEELLTARHRLEEVLGASVTEAAIPFGYYNWPVLRALKKAGYRRVFSSDEGPAREEAWFQPRNSLRRFYSLETLRRKLDYRPWAPDTLWREVKITLKKLRWGVSPARGHEPSGRAVPAPPPAHSTSR